ncbi:MAG TPA: BMP family protein [Caldilineaceae bacterium]|nr:BMP family protein [Caldilineaceae bacterium]
MDSSRISVGRSHVGRISVAGWLLLVVLWVAACTQATAPATTTDAAQPAGEQAATPATEGEEATPAAEAAPGEAEGELPSIALVLIGPREDNSWAEAAYNALQAQAEKGLETAFSESVSDADVARVMRDYAEQGFDIIIAHSFSYQDAVFEVAAEYPDVNFAWAGAIGRTAENVADYDQPFYQAAYLAGILAGHVSASGSLGAVYGFDIPACHAMGEALLAGAQTVNPEATLTVSAVGDWGDVAASKEAALAQVDTAGVDYFVTCGEAAALGAIEAAQEAGVYTTGYVGDMSELGPEVVLASVVWNMNPIFDAIVAETQAGAFDGPYYQFGVADGALDIAINPALAGQIPAEALADVDEARAAIQAGELEVPFIPE